MGKRCCCYLFCCISFSALRYCLWEVVGRPVITSFSLDELYQIVERIINDFIIWNGNQYNADSWLGDVYIFILSHNTDKIKIETHHVYSIYGSCNRGKIYFRISVYTRMSWTKIKNRECQQNKLQEAWLNICFFRQSFLEKSRTILVSNLILFLGQFKQSFNGFNISSIVSDVFTANAYSFSLAAATYKTVHCSHLMLVASLLVSYLHVFHSFFFFFPSLLHSRLIWLE